MRIYILWIKSHAVKKRIRAKEPAPNRGATWTNRMADRATRASAERFVVRRAAVDDIPGVIRIDASNTGLAKPDYWRTQFERFGGRPQRYFLVADRDGQVIAFIVGEVRAWEFGSPPCGWIFAIGVDAESRMGRLGTRLFDAIMDRFRADGVDTVRTMVRVEDQLLMSFFRSQGMTAGPSIQLEIPVDWEPMSDEAAS